MTLSLIVKPNPPAEAGKSDASRSTKSKKPRKKAKPAASDKRRQKDAEKITKARAALRTLVEQGKPINRGDWAGKLDVGENTIQRAEIQERARLEGISEGIRQERARQDPNNQHINPDVELPPERRKKIAEELLREQLRANRQARTDAANAQDPRPKLALPTNPVIMFGIQLWPPLPETQQPPQIRYLQYDYDQLFFATLQFTAWKELLPPTHDHISRAARLRERTKPLYHFSTRRLQGQSQSEMKTFLAIMHALANLYEANPNGQCQPPFDIVMRTN